MKLFWQKVISNKSNPLYWPIVLVLWLVSLTYRFNTYMERSHDGSQIVVDPTVISVGNLTVGGAGKTPLVIALAGWLVEKKYKVGIVARGYGRQCGGYIIGTGGDLRQKQSAEIGDEPLMMAECLPDVHFAVGRAKWKAARKLTESARLDFIIIDDGFQHFRLYRDFDIVAIDSRHDLRRECTFPLGRLRETPKNLKIADYIALTRMNQAGVDVDFVNWLKKSFPDKCIIEINYNSSFLISAQDKRPPEFIKGKRVLAFSGIADNQSFVESIRRLEPWHLETISFADHCRYNKAEIESIIAQIESFHPDLVLTTHKDYVKVRNFSFSRTVYYITVVPEFISGWDDLTEMLEEYVMV